MKAASNEIDFEYPIKHRTILIVILMLLGAMLSLANVYGNRRQIELQGRWAQTVAQENDAFCRKFGGAPGASLQSECVSALNELSKQHEKHLQADNEGFL